MLKTTKLMAMAALAPLVLSFAQPSMANDPATENDRGATNVAPANSDERADAQDIVKEAKQVVANMKKDPNAASLLKQAKGVFIVPDYAKAAFIVGGKGGSGVLVAHTGNGWSDPAFYDIGAISLGAQAGAEAGQIAMILMTDKALNSFKGNNNFSLNAQAGLTIVNYSGRTQASAGKGDVVVWANTSGALVDASFNVTDIKWDTEQNRAYYGEQEVSASEILEGEEKNPMADPLREEFPG